ncbi:MULTISPECIES: hypothetical protein [unclassified Bradyrhizobium]|uniref:hypothetical protein n=1 Tax=unclassified Bradyrhizobium TaxID=2631580 RepID=UPI0028E67604|nr:MULTISPECIES: hypothetical protein [unclassified Bradyrhizobium]
MTKPVVYIVGADKGGVGKTTTTRTLIDYLDRHGIGNRAFDTQTDIPGGTLKRFYPDRTELVDLLDSDGQMRVFDTLNAQIATVIDIRASLLSPTLQILSDIGFLDSSKLDIRLLHVLGNSQASIEEVAPVASKLAGMRHILVGNRINATKFAFPADALDIPMLVPAMAEAVDKSNQPFSLFAKSNPSAVMRGTVGTWLDRVFAQYARVQLP